MEKRKGQKRIGNRLGNKGSTFIIVVVAVSFLSVLGTIIIAISSANLQMKQLEHSAKKNFYTDEKVLDDIYHGIGKVSAEYLSKAYTDVLARVSDDNGVPIYKNQEDAFNAFSNEFVDKLIGKYGAKGPGAPAIVTLLQSYITVGGSVKVESYDSIDIVYTDASEKVPYQYAFRDVVVKYRVDTGAETGYEAAITTDIVIEVPYINFFQDSSRVMDYAMIANKGIYFSEASDRKVTGNVYAGINKKDDPDDLQKYRGISISNGEVGVSGGLNFYNANVTFDSNYLISKGDINVRYSDVTIGNTASMAYTQVWAETIRTVEKENRLAAKEPSTLNIKGNIYVANDLELNARESDVTLAGAYYGYNGGRYVTYETWESKGPFGEKYDPAGHTRSSAIIINGNESSLDISELETLVVSGVAYVDLVSKPYSDSYVPLPATIAEYATGESLALKASQYIYLAPSHCLSTTNPVKLEDAPADDDVWVDTGGESWFGIQGGYLASQPVKGMNVVNRTNPTETYRYYYLQFESEQGKVDYAELILNMQEDINDIDSDLQASYEDFSDSQLAEIWSIKKALQERVDASVIQIDHSASANIYTKGAMTRVSETGDVDSPLVSDANKLTDDYIGKLESELYKHYIFLYKYLDPKEGISLTSNPGPVTPGDYDDLQNDTDPAAQFVDFSKLETAGDPPQRDYRDSLTNKTIISSGDVVVNDPFSGIILCKGKVTINNVDVKGLIIAGGKIYVNGNGSIQADRSVVQSILDEEMREESKKASDLDAEINYAITYLKDIDVNYSGTDNTHRISGTDYTEFMSYENWRKGDID